MNVALVIAGGSGQRMGMDIPKQFILVEGKPIIVYTLETFERHPMVDAIEVVCVDGWHDQLLAYAHEYGIEKLRWVVPGGHTAQESIRNGVFALEPHCKDDDIVIVHDSIRPIVDEFVLTDVVEMALEKGNAVTSLPYNEQIFLLSEEDPTTTTAYIPRETLRRVSTPQAYRFDLIDSKYHEAYATGVGIRGSAYANTMMVELGVRLNFAKGSDKNIKLTTSDDLEIFRGYVNAKGRIPGGDCADTF